MRLGFLDIEIYDTKDPKETWAQGKFLVHGWDDVMWTDDIKTAVQFFTDSLARMSDTEIKEGFCAKCGEKCDYC